MKIRTYIFTLIALSFFANTFSMNLSDISHQNNVKLTEKQINFIEQFEFDINPYENTKITINDNIVIYGTELPKNYKKNILLYKKIDIIYNINNIKITSTEDTYNLVRLHNNNDTFILFNNDKIYLIRETELDKSINPCSEIQYISISGLSSFQIFN